MKTAFINSRRNRRACHRKKYKKFLNLDARQKRRRLSTNAPCLRNSESMPQDSNYLYSTLNNDSRNNTAEIILHNSALCTSEDSFENDEEHSTGNSEYISDTGEEVEDSADTEEEVEESDSTVQEQKKEEKEENVAEDIEETYYEDNKYMCSLSEDDNENLPENPDELKKRALRNAFLNANLKHGQGNVLLRTLRDFPFNLTCLPKDTRTLLETPAVVATRHVQHILGGEYLHIGFKRRLIKKLESLDEDMLPEFVEIEFSTDGAQIHKSGTAQVWLYNTESLI